MRPDVLQTHALQIAQVFERNVYGSAQDKLGYEITIGHKVNLIQEVRLRRVPQKRDYIPFPH